MPFDSIRPPRQRHTPMLKAVYYFSIVLSVLAFAGAAILLYHHLFDAESPGMVMIYFIPLAFASLLVGLLAVLLRQIGKTRLGGTPSWVFNLLIGLLAVDAAMLIYGFMN